MSFDSVLCLKYCSWSTYAEESSQSSVPLKADPMMRDFRINWKQTALVLPGHQRIQRSSINGYLQTASVSTLA
jgi:hypothetical protein